MTTPSISTPLPYPQAAARALRTFSLVVAIVVLAAVSFLVWRTTAGSSSPAVRTHPPAPVVAPLNHVSGSTGGEPNCHYGPAC